MKGFVVFFVAGFVKDCMYVLLYSRVSDGRIVVTDSAHARDVSQLCKLDGNHARDKSRLCWADREIFVLGEA